MASNEQSGIAGEAASHHPGTYLHYGPGPDGHTVHDVQASHQPSYGSGQTDNTILGNAADEQITPTKDEYLDEKGEELAEDTIGIERMDTNYKRNFQPLDSIDEETVMGIARTMTRSYSQYSTANKSDLQRTDTLAGLQLGDEIFDPASPKFDLYKYLRMTMKILKEDDVKIQNVGVTMKDVNVRGSGSALNLQSTLSTVLSAPLRLGELLSSRHKPSKHSKFSPGFATRHANIDWL